MKTQQCLTAVYPIDQIAEKAHESEKKVYEGLKEAIPKGKSQHFLSDGTRVILRKISFCLFENICDMAY